MFMRRNRRQYFQLCGDARALVKARLEYFNKQYGYAPGKIFIKNHKSRWGSCSKKGNLNFNYKVVLLPLPITDYIVVHELCHLKEFNHSPRFWALVAKTIPDYRVRQHTLRRIEQMKSFPEIKKSRP